MARFRLELVVFLSGACVMILELVGSRILAPYVGTSIYVWTSLIGIILASLSLGYWWGGRLSDRRPRASVLAGILFGAALWTAGLALWSSRILEFVVLRITDVRTGSVAATLLLFFVPSVLMGMVSPYAVRLKIHTVDRSGSTVGTLYAVSTIGSIVGTFLAGFVLVVAFSNPRILLLVAVVLAVASFLAHTGRLLPARVAVLVPVAAMGFWKPAFLGAAPHATVVDENTLYSRAWVYDDSVESDGETLDVRFLRIGNERSGAMFMRYWDLAYPYTEFFRLAEHFRPGFDRGLMIGGGAYSFPKEYLRRYPEATLDVVEIDPKVTELARRYFWLEDDPRLRIHDMDGRVYLNRTDETYDVIYLDAFRSYYYIPPHLVTREAFEEMNRALSPDGVVVANLLCILEGEGSEVFRAVYRTLSEVFPRVLVFPVKDAARGDINQNVMLVALKSDRDPSLVSADPFLQGLLDHFWDRPVPRDLPVLRDDFAPVDHYVLEAIPKSITPVRELIRRLDEVRRPEERVPAR